MIMTELQALGDVLPKCPKMGADTLVDGLQGFKPGAMQGRMDAHALGRTMLHRHKDGPGPSCRVKVVVISGPHIVSTRSVMIVPSWALGPWGSPWRVGASKP